MTICAIPPAPERGQNRGARYRLAGREFLLETERKLFLSIIAILLGFGILMVYSASITSRPSEYEQVFLSRHLIFLSLALASCLVAGSLPADWWLRSAPWLFWATVGILVLVLIPGVGARINGAQRWFRYGSISLQPSEIAKITLPLYLCWLMERRRDVLQTWLRGTIPVAYPIVMIVPLVLAEPDLGTSIFLLLGGGMALFVGGWPIRNFVAGALAAVPAGVLVVLQKSYQMKRIAGFLKTWADWTEAPYQLKQSLVTLGAGGMWGVGLGKGFQKLSFLPEANTDFVFAVIGEELGLVGMLSLIALWIGLFVMGWRLLRPLNRGSFAYQAALTLLTQLLLQVAVNVAVVTAMVPPKGIAHPLISYGGSNLVITLTALGIFISLTQDPRPELSREGAGIPSRLEPAPG